MGCAPSNDATFIVYPNYPNHHQMNEPVYQTYDQRYELVYTTQGQRDEPVSPTSENIEYWRYIYEDSQMIKLDLKMEKHTGDHYIPEYLNLLERFIKLYELHHGNIPRNPSRGYGDPNDVAFPLPVSSKCLRPWVDKVNSVSFLGGIFSFEIEGEAAWYVFPKDIIKNDIQTPAQEDIWRARKNRADLHDPARMNKRRQKLAYYFNKKYAEGDDTYSAKYLQFTDNLDAGWKRFQQLCVQ